MQEKRMKEPSEKCQENLGSKVSSSSSHSSSEVSGIKSRSSIRNKRNVQLGEPDPDMKKRRTSTSDKKNLWQDYEDDTENDMTNDVDTRVISELKEDCSRYKQLFRKMQESAHSLRDELKEVKQENTELKIRVEKLLGYNLVFQDHLANCLKISDTNGVSVVDKNKTLIGADVPKSKNNQAPYIKSKHLISSKAQDQLNSMDSTVVSTERITAPFSSGSSAAEESGSEEAASGSNISTSNGSNTSSGDESPLPSNRTGSTNSDIVTEDSVEQTQSGPTDQGAEYIIGCSADSSEKTVEIHPTVFIKQRAYTANFKNFLKCPPRVYADGSAGDRKFIKDAAVIMWSEEELATHSVSGKPCNLKKEATANPLPALCSIKVGALAGGLLRRVLIEKSKKSPLEAAEMKVAERAHITNVRRWIGEVIHNAKKRTKNRINKATVPALEKKPQLEL